MDIEWKYWKHDWIKKILNIVMMQDEKKFKIWMIYVHRHNKFVIQNSC